MPNDYLNLDDINEQVLNIIKGFKLTPIAFGIAIKLKKDEFEQIAKNHPHLVEPGLILKTKSEADGFQWYVQISEEVFFKDISND